MDTGSSSAVKVVIGLAAAVILLAGMREAAPILAPPLLGLLVAVVLIPVQQRLAVRIGRLPAFLTSLAMMLVGILGFAALIGLGTWALSRSLVRYAWRSDFLMRQADAIIARFGIQVADLVEVARDRAGSGLEAAIGVGIEVLYAVGDFTLMLLVVGFVLADAMVLAEKARMLDRMTEDSVERISRVVHDVRGFLKVTGVVGLITGALSTLIFLALGVDLALLWGVLIAVMSFVPYIGFWLALVPPTTLAMLESGLPVGLVVLVGTMTIHALTGNVVKPKLLSDGLNLSPFTVFFSVIVWSFILGPLGAILSIPLTMLVREMLVEPDPALGWLALLMGKRAEMPEAVDRQMDGARSGRDAHADRDAHSV